MARHWAYRIGGGLLVWVAAAMVGTDIGLLWAGPDAEGFDALGAAIFGFLAGAVVGLAAGILFGLASPPGRALHRRLMVAALAALVVLASLLQETLDDA